jgi:hypothetical protein
VAGEIVSPNRAPRRARQQGRLEFQSNPRNEIQMRGQKTWYNPAVSDFADEAEIVGMKGGSEMAEQIADAIIAVAFQIEKRCLSNEDTKADDGVKQGNETRGAFSTSWTARRRCIRSRRRSARRRDLHRHDGELHPGSL